MSERRVPISSSPRVRDASASSSHVNIDPLAIFPSAPFNVGRRDETLALSLSGGKGETYESWEREGRTFDGRVGVCGLSLLPRTFCFWRRRGMAGVGAVRSAMGASISATSSSSESSSSLIWDMSAINTAGTIVIWV